MSTLTDLQAVHARLGENLGPSVFGVIVLLDLVHGGLQPPSPQGSPDTIRDCARDYEQAAAQTGLVGADLAHVAASDLPSAWRGQVAETAAQAVQGVAAEVHVTAGVLSRAAVALSQWAVDLERAQTSDAQGTTVLSELWSQLATLGLSLSPASIATAQAQALAGVGLRVAAAQLAQTTATSTASLLDQLTQQARAERLQSGQLDALSSVVSANETNPNGQDILSSNAMARASQRLAAMSPSDQAAFEKLLAQSKSPVESAYLLKALAAGHDLTQVAAFDAAIHGHGDDPAWLAKHLTPDISANSSSDHYFGKYGNDPDASQDPIGLDVLDQGQVNDCVAASTVIAQANVDPTVMLALTTGGTSDGDDSPAAFHRRLQDLYISNYRTAQTADGTQLLYPYTDKGIGSTGIDKLADQDLGSSTGSSYHYESMSTNDDRQSTIPRIEQAVDSGKPVPLDINGTDGAHQVMIIGRDGDKLEIYNPWGYTTWVTESQYVNGDIGAVTSVGGDGSLKNPYGVELPD